MKKYILLLILSISCFHANAQKEGNWWYFGNNAGLNFNIPSTVNSSTGVPTPNMPKAVTGPLYTNEGCFVLSDKNGNLMMSSDGSTIYNSNNTVMANGSGMAGGSSSTQSGIVVPVPGQNNQFYAISLAQDLGAPGITYSIVDMTLNGGLGGVLATNKNKTLLAGSTDENIAAVKNSNGTDYWLIHRSLNKRVGGLPAIYVWAVTSSGISAPTTYTFPNNNAYTAINATYVGCMKLSSDGTKFVNPVNRTRKVLFGDFNPATGVVSNIQLSVAMPDGNDGYTYAAEFSPSGDQVFISNSSYFLFQISWQDLKGLTVIPFKHPQQTSNLQMGSDGRIFGIKYGTRDLFVIMDPESSYNVVDIRTFPNYLTANAAFGLPTFAASFFNSNPIIAPFGCAGNDFKYTVEVTTDPTIVGRIEWDFGDGSAKVSQNITAGTTTYSQMHNYNAAGQYTVTINSYKASDNSLFASKKMPAVANIVDCVIKSNRMIRVNLPNAAEKQLKN